MAFSENYGNLVYEIHHGYTRDVDSHSFWVGCFGQVDEKDGHRGEAVMHS